MARIPNQDALALAPSIGWLTLAGCLCLLAIAIADRDRWAKFWLRSEDPRPLAALRIAVSGLTLVNINGLFECAEFLFSDEGIFTTETARQVLASKQFAGYGDGFDGAASGFFDLAGVWAFLKGPKYSLLFFSSTPWVVWAHIALNNVVLIAYMVGYRSRISGWLSFALFVSLFTRNPLFWTGADLVFRCLLLYLAMARTGAAYSVDNWLRCRRLARAGQLSRMDHAEAGAGRASNHRDPGGLLPIYRRVPAWPRMLIILQIATIYFWTGCAKTGNVWLKGDALYYALSLDHFYRVPTQLMATVFGTNLFRLMSWVVHIWQIGFPIFVVGLIVRWAHGHGLRGPKGAWHWVWRGAWLGLVLLALAIFELALPVHYAPRYRGDLSVEQLGLLVGVAWIVLVAIVGLLWRPTVEGGLAWISRDHRMEHWWRTGLYVLFSRRLWLGLGLIFHLQILMLMNIGMFAPVMIASYLAFINGQELASLLRFLRCVALRAIGRASDIERLPAITPVATAELEPNFGHRSRAPILPLVTAGVCVLLAFVWSATNTSSAHWGYFCIAVAVLFWLRPWQRLAQTSVPSDVAPGRAWPWAYSPRFQRLPGLVIATQLICVAAWSIPDKDCTRSFRPAARKLVKPWLGFTQSTQSWNMFAPNPPRSNTFLMANVTDAGGEVWDLRIDANSPRHKVHPWVWYSRWGKITRRIAGNGEWYRKWYARYLCRRWALDHDGEMPQKVDLIKQWYKIPSPEEARRHGPTGAADRLASHGRRRYIHHVRCAREVDAQLDNEVRQRHGLPLVPESTIRRWKKRRLSKWERRRG